MGGGELEPLEARGNFEKVLGSKQPLRLLLRKRGPFSNAPKKKIYIKVDVFSNGFALFFFSPREY